MRSLHVARPSDTQALLASRSFSGHGLSIILPRIFGRYVELWKQRKFGERNKLPPRG